MYINNSTMCCYILLVVRVNFQSIPVGRRRSSRFTLHGRLFSERWGIKSETRTKLIITERFSTTLHEISKSPRFIVVLDILRVRNC